MGEVPLYMHSRCSPHVSPCPHHGALALACEDRVLDGPASGEKGSKRRN